MDSKPATRRRHGDDLKTQVLRECNSPGASVATVALAHGLNANLVHKWRRLARAGRPGPSALPEPKGFVALPLSSAAAPAAPALHDIRIELRRGAMAASITWPVAAAAQCRAWMRELLR